VTDIDVELKRLFDDRLEPMKPPPRTMRRTSGRLRVAAAAATAAVVIAGAGLAIDVNSVAAANGVDCAGFLTKLHVWAQSHRGDLVGTDHSAAKAELAKMVAESGCAPHDATHDASHIGPHH
jgi:hypothetical protein